MKKNSAINLTVLLTIVFLFGLKREIYAQDNQVRKTKSDFFNNISIKNIKKRHSIGIPSHL